MNLFYHYKYASKTAVNNLDHSIGFYFDFSEFEE